MRFTLLLCALLAPLGSGCFVIASTDDFVQDEGCDLELDLRQFNPHLNQEVQIRLTQLDPGAGAGATDYFAAFVTLDRDDAAGDEKREILSAIKKEVAKKNKKKGKFAGLQVTKLKIGFES